MMSTEGPQGLQPAVRAETLADQTYRLVKEWVLSSAAQPDAIITERGLAERLGVSRTPLREVLRILEYEGLIERSPGGQMAVRSLSMKDIEQIHDCLLRIEPLAARLAAQNATDAQIEALVGCVKGAWEAYGAGDGARVLANNGLFHGTIYEAADNPWLLQAGAPLRSQMQRLRVLFTETHHDSGWHAEHEAVAEAIAAHDPDAAEAAMAAHVIGDRRVFLSPPPDEGKS